MKLIRHFAPFMLVAILFSHCSKKDNSDPTTDTVGTLTDIDGNTYKTVVIGTQTWMAENLKSTTYADGTPLTSGNSLESNFINPYDKYYFNYPVDDDYQAIYGLHYTHLRENVILYNWDAASRANESGIDRQGICPNGWHLPSMNEWNQLFDFVGKDSAAIFLKNNDQNFWQCDNHQQLTDEFEFKVLPTGGRAGIENFYIFDVYAHFWSTTETSQGMVWTALFTCSDEVIWDSKAKPNAFPVRCIKD